MGNTGRITVVAAVAVSLLLSGCAAGSGAAEQSAPAPAPVTPSPGAPGGTYIEIPRTTNRPSYPPLPSDYDQETNSGLTPEEASLNQLWGLASSEAGPDADPAGSSGMQGLADFAAAIEARCHPLLAADEVAELQRLWADYESAPTGNDAFAPAQAYFARATELCM